MAGCLKTALRIELFQLIQRGLRAGLDKGCHVSASGLRDIGIAIVAELNAGCDVAIAVLGQN